MSNHLHRRLIKKVLFGDTLLSQEFFIGLPEPQTEISVWLDGLGAPVDVTRCHTTACAAPFTVCIALEETRKPGQTGSLTLKFCQRSREQKVLGEIKLKLVATISAAGLELCFFEARSSANYCLPSIRLYAHYLLHAYRDRGMSGASDVNMSFLEKRAAMVSFIRPHPVVLGSVSSNHRGNIFPMNIMGDLGPGYFGFALKDSRRAAHLVETYGRIALSSLPMAHAPLAYQLAINHTKETIEWNELPFATKPSPQFRIPVPEFAPRVREMEVARVHRIGSHTFFLAHVLTDEIYSPAVPVLSVVHGFYQAWRLKDHSGDLEASVAEDVAGKRGIYRAETHSESSRVAKPSEAGLQDQASS